MKLFLDCTKIRTLETTFRKQCNWDKLEMLRNCRHAQTPFSWRLHLSSMRGSVLSQGECVVNVRKGLGAALIRHNLNCRVCGTHLDRQVYHRDACGTGMATRGYYMATGSVLKRLCLADPSAQTELRGFTKQNLRPARILTNAAVPGRSVALDLCVVKPQSIGAGKTPGCPRTPTK